MPISGREGRRDLHINTECVGMSSPPLTREVDNAAAVDGPHLKRVLTPARENRY